MERSEITLDENLQFKSENLKRRIDDTQTILKSWKPEQGNEKFKRSVEFYEKFTYSSIKGEFIQITKIVYDINCDEDIIFCELIHDGKSLMKYTKIDNIEYYESRDRVDMTVDIQWWRIFLRILPSDNYSQTNLIVLYS